MIIYENNKKYFLEHVKSNKIADILKHSFKARGIGGGGYSEYRSWDNSLQKISNIISTANIPDDVYITLEYRPHMGGERIDVMILGQDCQGNKNFLIIELKQWEKITDTNRPDIVSTFIGKSVREVLHPSYQAQGYLRMIADYNQDVCSYLKGKAIAYLHNAKRENNLSILNPKLYSHVEKNDIYFKYDTAQLTNLISKLTCNGKGKEILYIIENGKLSPSKKLMDVTKDMLKGSEAFFLIGNQKIILENILVKANENGNVFIVNGNPGTGKSVVALNLLSKLINLKQIVHFVAPNAAYRNSLIESLRCSESNVKYLKSLFRSSTNFLYSENNTYDWLIVDEAHRLKGQGTYMYKGKSQIDDIIKASKNIVFFVDEKQIIRPNDIGSIENIIANCKKHNKKVFCDEQYRLSTQFRCSGANGYVNAVLQCLQIEETANYFLNGNEKYDFKIFDDPNLMKQEIEFRQGQGFKANILAGYAWKWQTKGMSLSELDYNNDVIMPEYDFAMPWNYSDNSMIWLSRPYSKKQVGCVHVVQGLELDYAGVIIGNDLSINDEGNLISIRENYYDLVGKKGLKNKKQLDDYIKNIYYILMTRGQKGTYLFVRDKKLREYFKKFINKN